MRARRWKWIFLVLLILIGVAVVIATAHRDSIGREIVNRALKDGEYRVTDLSVDSLSQDQVSLSELVLERSDGSLIAIEGIALPVDIRVRRIERLSVDAVRYTPAPDSGQPQTYADLVNTVLLAHERLPDAEVSVGEIELPWLPVLIDVQWQSMTSGQTARFDVADFQVSASVNRQDDGSHEFALEILAADGVEALAYSGRIRGSDLAVTIEGEADIALEYWLPVMHALGAAPEALRALSGLAQGSFGALLPRELSDEHDSPVEVRGIAAFDNAIELAWAPADGTSLDVALASESGLGVAFLYPSLRWEAEIDSARASVTAGETRFGFDLDAVRCKSGIHCDADVDYAINDLAAGGLAVESVSAKVPLSVDVAGSMLLKTRTPATIDLHGVSYGEHALDLVEMSGNLSSDGEELTAGLDLTSGAASGNLELQHSIETGRGTLRLRQMTLSFADQNASDITRAWNQKWDIVAGDFTASVDAEWRIGESPVSYRADSELELAGLAGHINDLAFKGLATKLAAGIEEGNAPEVGPFDIDISLFDIGLPIENIEARLVPDLEKRSVDVSGLRMDVLGGEITADALVFGFDDQTNNIVLLPKGIQLQLMVDVAESSGIEVDGSVSGMLPVALSDEAITIDGGRLENDPPGGVIRLGERFTGMTDDSRFNIVTEALSNFHFDSLTADVTYSGQGDLKMQMRMSGNNPDMDPDQPVILNLGLENNVPQLLRSLQAGRSISDILGRKVVQ
jgi:hypothetical protein